jgi:hypothetical protein
MSFLAAVQVCWGFPSVDSQNHLPCAVDASVTKRKKITVRITICTISYLFKQQVSPCIKMGMNDFQLRVQNVMSKFGHNAWRHKLAQFTKNGIPLLAARIENQEYREPLYFDKHFMPRLALDKVVLLLSESTVTTSQSIHRADSGVLHMMETSIWRISSLVPLEFQ